MQVNSVGVIGLGDTGGAVARRLLDRHLQVTVHDRDLWKVLAMVEAGARPARLPADAAEPGDLVFVHMPDEAATEEVLFDCGGVGETLHDGGLVVIASTTDSAFVRSAACRLWALGLNTVEAWFPGRPGPSEEAGDFSSAVFVGCAPEDLPAVRPLLTAVGGNVLHTGPVGSVAALKRLAAASSGVRPPGPPQGRARAGSTLPGPRPVVAVTPVAGPADGPPPGRWNGHRSAALADAVGDVWSADWDAVPSNGRHRSPAAGSRAPGCASDPRSGEAVEPCDQPPSRGLLSTAGAFSLQELEAAIVAVSGRIRPPRDGASAGAGGRAGDANCLGLERGTFDDVIAELERRCRIPLLEEALLCTTPAQLVAMVNTQLTSGA